MVLFDLFRVNASSNCFLNTLISK